MGNKVSWDTYDSYPVCLVGEKYRPENKPQNGQNYPAQIKTIFREKIKCT